MGFGVLGMSPAGRGDRGPGMSPGRGDWCGTWDWPGRS